MAVGDTATAIICSNRKGGVGKTTTAVHLGCGLAELGVRVLLWDLDAGHGATSHLGCADNLRGSLEVLAGDAAPADVILSGRPGFHGVDLLPAGDSMEALDRLLLARSGPYSQPWQCLHEPLRRVRALRRYDVVLFDPGPNANTAARAALAVSDWLLVVLTCDRPCAEALGAMLNQVEQARRPGVNPDLRVLGAVLNMVDHRTALGREYRESYREQLEARGYPGTLLRTEIPDRQAFARAWQQGKALWSYRHRDASALTAVRALAREVADRLDLEPTDAATPLRRAAV